RNAAKKAAVETTFYTPANFAKWLRVQVVTHLSAKRGQRCWKKWNGGSALLGEPSLSGSDEVRRELKERAYVYSHLWFLLRTQGVEVSMKMYQEDFKRRLSKLRTWTMDTEWREAVN